MIFISGQNLMILAIKVGALFLFLVVVMLCAFAAKLLGGWLGMDLSFWRLFALLATCSLFSSWLHDVATRRGPR